LKPLTWQLKIKMSIKKLICFDKSYLLIIAFIVLIPFQKTIASNIGPDDVLRISVYGYDDLKTETRVSSDGRISFPLIGEVDVLGKSTMELEEAIAIRLINGGFIHDAQVSVAVLEHNSQQVSVLGYVNKQGRYPLDSDTSIVDLIAMAEGIDENGDNKVVVTRIDNGKPHKQELNLRDYMDSSSDLLPFKMRQGDTVYVPKAPHFYIYGEVLKPGNYRIENELSVVEALAIGGGLTPKGTENDIVIKRKDANGILQEIEANPSDSVLKDDVIYVDERWF
jgi:polysaccharide biosynthesis/export protein